jgi:hypothetical protein
MNERIEKLGEQADDYYTRWMYAEAQLKKIKGGK